MRIAAALLCLAALLAASPALARDMQEAGIAVLRTIDKVSARTSTFEVPVGKTVKFASGLFIKPRACRKASPLDSPESAAFLQVWEKKPGSEQSDWVFSGWMFASKPAVSAMEHPVYDVWLIACKDAAEEKGADKAKDEGAKKGAEAEEAFSTESAPDDAATKPVADTPVAPEQSEENITD